MRILFDKNVPVGVRRFLTGHEVHTVVELNWPPQLENGELLDAAEAAGFDVMITSDQNIDISKISLAENLPSWCLGRISGLSSAIMEP